MNLTAFLTCLTNIPAGTPIRKPQSEGRSQIKGWGKRRGEDALIYRMPNGSDPSKPHEKGVTCSELAAAFKQLTTHGTFERNWFNENMSKCAKEGPCNFTTIGGLFEYANIASYTAPGKYSKK